MNKIIKMCKDSYTFSFGLTAIGIFVIVFIGIM